MERLFSPFTRYRELAELQAGRERFRRQPPEGMQELNLDVSTEELLSAEKALTYGDLYAMLGDDDTIAWLTPHAAVARQHGNAAIAWNQLDGLCYFCFYADGKGIIALARSAGHLLEICDIVLRLLAVSVVHSVMMDKWSAPTLTYLAEQSQSSLKALTLKNLEMDENHFRVLGAYDSRPGLEIVLHCCKITSAGASALVEILGRNQGPTKIDFCQIDNFVLANGLRGNSRLKSLIPRISGNPDVGNREVLAIAGALRENKGLIDLDLVAGSGMNDVTWGAPSVILSRHIRHLRS
jgi:hypothetical protein